MPGRSPECRQHTRARTERAKAAANPDAGIDMLHDERTPVERADDHFLGAMLAMLGDAIALTLPPASNKRHASRMPLLYLPLRFALLEGIDAYEEERESARTRQVYRRRPTPRARKFLRSSIEGRASFVEMVFVAPTSHSVKTQRRRNSNNGPPLGRVQLQCNQGLSIARVATQSPPIAS